MMFFKSVIGFKEIYRMFFISHCRRIRTYLKSSVPEFCFPIIDLFNF